MAAAVAAEFTVRSAVRDLGAAQLREFEAQLQRTEDAIRAELKANAAVFQQGRAKVAPAPRPMPIPATPASKRRCIESERRSPAPCTPPAVSFASPHVPAAAPKAGPPPLPASLLRDSARTPQTAPGPQRGSMAPPPPPQQRVSMAPPPPPPPPPQHQQQHHSQALQQLLLERLQQQMPPPDVRVVLLRPGQAPTWSSQAPTRPSQAPTRPNQAPTWPSQQAPVAQLQRPFARQIIR
ncbi:hypothetical protein HYH03_014754 [Edaphochlamys debaryana]|uniref:Uncharacterized protein n=1 Tax=Edaphochlamys debaryana TaxID=47281 RepID=A0A835XN49_9CHLO|nr:hypothetical protein HYH03_014754 [Edaphochlamys debaryana]|eukprot:KAG2486584.1 hypothetical protein HYH03_014754 [Edaphochlamys debaryana]